MAIIPVLKRDAPPNVLAWKFPSTELSTWSQLIVAESQEAVLVKEGQFVGSFTAGRHVLSTENYPILSTLYKIPFGRSPFTEEVWFTQRAFSLDIRWGTSDAMLLEDPEYHLMLPVRAFGQYGLCVENSRMFLEKLVGSLQEYTILTLTQHFKGIILSLVKSVIAKQLVEKKIPILKISTTLEDISEALHQALASKLEPYGVKFVNFCVNSINTDEKDPAVDRLRRAMAERAEMQIVGFNYQQKRSFDVMQTAAGDEGAGGVQSGMMGAGIGMGMGVGLGQNFGSQMQQATSQTSTYGSNVNAYCPQCGAPHPQGGKFCQHCGRPLAPPSPSACPQCGSSVTPGARFCANCGRQL